MSMADYAVENKEEGAVARSNNMAKQLGVAVRSVQWSYAIFWSMSTTQQGVLEWSYGYYNGDIKKRKKDEVLELKAHEFGLQRSKQLRQLYLSMLEGGEDDQSKTVLLSPDDLSDEEWYYLVCMSYVFNPGQGLPGRSLAKDETIWVCNAQYAESKVFARSLLAMSASIQTVVCFPYQGGVIELGVTELIAEDRNLLQHIKACLLDFSKPDCHGRDPSISCNHDDDDEKNETGSKNRQSDLSRSNQDLQKGTHSRLCSMDLGLDEDLNYNRTVSTVLRCVNRIKKTLDLDCSSGLDSSFTSWRKGEIGNSDYPPQGQNLLKKILNAVPPMHCSYKDTKSEDETFCVLRSTVPKIQEIDKASILNNTIIYLKYLETRVEKLESRIGSVDIDRPSTIQSEAIEETSENYENAGSDSTKDQRTNRSKCPNVSGVTKRDCCRDSGAVSSSNVKVKIREEEVLIEVKCVYREYIVADIMDAASNLHLDAYSVQSSTSDDSLTLSLKAKFRGAAVALPAGMIKRELEKVAGVV